MLVLPMGAFLLALAIGGVVYGVFGAMSGQIGRVLPVALALLFGPFVSAILTVLMTGASLEYLGNEGVGLFSGYLIGLLAGGLGGALWGQRISSQIARIKAT